MTIKIQICVFPYIYCEHTLRISDEKVNTGDNNCEPKQVVEEAEKIKI